MHQTADGGQRMTAVSTPDIKQCDVIHVQHATMHSNSADVMSSRALDGLHASANHIDSKPIRVPTDNVCRNSSNHFTQQSA